MCYETYLCAESWLRAGFYLRVPRSWPEIVWPARCLCAGRRPAMGGGAGHVSLPWAGRGCGLHTRAVQQVDFSATRGLVTQLGRAGVKLAGALNTGGLWRYHAQRALTC